MGVVIRGLGQRVFKWDGDGHDGGCGRGRVDPSGSLDVSTPFLGSFGPVVVLSVEC